MNFINILKRAILLLSTPVLLYTNTDTSLTPQPDPTLITDVQSDYVFAVDAESGQVLAKRNEDERMYPASMTKMMTAILALEKTDDLSKTVVITSEMLAGLAEANASVAGFAESDTVTVEDLLYATALPSGADAANALAFLCAGSLENFTALMNQKAQELGMENTHFTNCTGLHDDDHYSTARDFSKLLLYCMENEDFRRIFSARSYTSSPTIWYPDGIEMNSTIFHAADYYGISLPGLSGGKTGFTYEAGHCLAYWAELNGITAAVVTGHADTYMYGYTHLSDASELLNALNGWEKTTIVETGQKLDQVIIHYSDCDVTADITSDRTLIYDMPKEGEIVIESTLPDEVDGKRKQSSVTGRITITKNGQLLFDETVKITIPREPKLTARISMWLNELFARKS